MSHRTIAAALSLVLAAGLAAQQTGDANRNYTINGSGANATSPVATPTSAPGPFTHAYSTLDPLAPVIWLTATGSTNGWIQTPNNSVDIGPLGIYVLADGGNFAFPWSLFFYTNPAGQLSLSFYLPPLPPGTVRFFAMGHAASTSPDGFWISQTHGVNFVLDPSLGPSSPAATPGSMPLALSDDSFAQVNLGFPFTFYATTYTTCFVGSNGYVTFGIGDTSLGESAVAMRNGPRRIALCWDDLDPSTGGTIAFYTDNMGTAEVSFSGVPEFNSPGSNTFKCRLIPGGPLITMDYGAMTLQDGLVGLSPGNAQDPVGLAANLSIAGLNVPPGMAVYQVFTPPNMPFDLSGFQLNFLLDASGNPVATF